MKKLLWVTIVTAGISVSAASQPVVQNDITVADNAKIDSFADSLFSNLEAGKTKAAIEGVFATSKLMDEKPQEMRLLISQINSALALYGNVNKCRIASVTNRAGLVQKRQYLCQHADFVTRWNLIFGKASTGWVTLSLMFDENITRIDDEQ